jgi:hypothetical protein
VDVRVPAGPLAVSSGIGRAVVAHGAGRVRVIGSGAPALAEGAIIARVVAEYLRRIVIRGHGSSP